MDRTGILSVLYHLSLNNTDVLLTFICELPLPFQVCVVDRQARCLVWGQLQLVMRDTPQLNAVLAVLRHADVQHMSVWPPQASKAFSTFSNPNQIFAFDICIPG